MILFATAQTTIHLDATNELGLMLVVIQYDPFNLQSYLLHTWN
jgi:hypothetical protein